MGDEIRGEDWVAGLPSEEETFDLESDNPEAFEAVKTLGYDGRIFFTIRTLTAAEKEDREAESVEFTQVGSGTKASAVLRNDVLRRFDVEHMIVDGRFPVLKGNGRGFREYPWDKTASGSGNNYKQVDSMSKGLLGWLLDNLTKVRGDDIEEDVTEAGNASTTPED